MSEPVFGTAVRRSFTERMMGAAKLDVSVYEEVEADTTATGQAAGVVALGAAAAAIGASGHGVAAMVGGAVAALVGWVVWSIITYLVGTRVFGGRADLGEMLRTLGFAQSPAVLGVLGIIPFVGGLVRLAIAVWVLVAGVIAVRQALDVDTGKAVLTVVIGWLAYVAIGMVFDLGGAAMALVLGGFGG